MSIISSLRPRVTCLPPNEGRNQKLQRRRQWGRDREEKRKKKSRWLDGDQAWTGHVMGRRAMELPAHSPFLSQQLVSLLAPSAWIRGPGWTDWPVGADHSQKTLLISHRLPRPHSHTLSLFLPSSPRRLRLKTVSREGRGFRKHVIMSSVPNADIHHSKKKKYLLLQNSALKFLTIFKGYYSPKSTIFMHESLAGGSTALCCLSRHFCVLSTC